MNHINAHAINLNISEQLPLFDSEGNIYSFLKPLSKITEIDRLIGDQLLSNYSTKLVTSVKLMHDLACLGVLDAKVIHEHRIGYGERLRPQILDQANSFEGSKVRGALQRLGLMNSKGRIVVYGQYVFQLKGLDNELVGVDGYYRVPSKVYGSENPVIFPGSDIGVFNINAMKDSDEATICRTSIMAARLLSDGVHNACALVSKSIDVKTFINFLKQLTLRNVSIYKQPGAFDDYWRSQLIMALKALKISYEVISE